MNKNFILFFLFLDNILFYWTSEVTYNYFIRYIKFYSKCAKNDKKAGYYII